MCFFAGGFHALIELSVRYRQAFRFLLLAYFTRDKNFQVFVLQLTI